jgi:hypothetical protein
MEPFSGTLHSSRTWSDIGDRTNVFYSFRALTMHGISKSWAVTMMSVLNNTTTYRLAIANARKSRGAPSFPSKATLPPSGCQLFLTFRQNKYVASFNKAMSPESYAVSLVRRHSFIRMRVVVISS